jgi:hypothetical protein
MKFKKPNSKTAQLVKPLALLLALQPVALKAVMPNLDQTDDLQAMTRE